jgi:hypothetical protein
MLDRPPSLVMTAQLMRSGARARGEAYAASCYIYFVVALPAYSYIIDEGICFMTVTSKPFNNRLTFAFLEDIKEGFLAELRKDYSDS